MLEFSKRKVMKTVVLRKPFELGEEWLEKLEFREPSVAELLAADKAASGSYAEELELISALCGIARPHLEKLGLEDYAECRVVVQIVTLMIETGMSWEAASKMLEQAKELMAKELESSDGGAKLGEAAGSATGQGAQEI